MSLEAAISICGWKAREGFSISCLCRTPKADLLQLLLDEWPDAGLLPGGKKDTTKKGALQNGKKNGVRQHMNGHALPKIAAAKEKVGSLHATHGHQLYCLGTRTVFSAKQGRKRCIPD